MCFAGVDRKGVPRKCIALLAAILKALHTGHGQANNVAIVLMRSERLHEASGCCNLKSRRNGQNFQTWTG